MNQLLGEFNSETPGGTNQSHHMQLANSDGYYFATGVSAITFEINQTNYSTYALADVWREIDVAGSATTTPEPGTFVLIGTGLLGLLAYAWRKRI